METYGESRPRIVCATLTSATSTMTIARLAATYGAIRRAMEIYGKSCSRIACATLTSAIPTMTIARLAATYGEIREDMGTYSLFIIIRPPDVNNHF